MKVQEIKDILKMCDGTVYINNVVVYFDHYLFINTDRSDGALALSRNGIRSAIIRLNEINSLYCKRMIVEMR